MLNLFLHKITHNAIRYDIKDLAHPRWFNVLMQSSIVGQCCRHQDSMCGINQL